MKFLGDEYTEAIDFLENLSKEDVEMLKVGGALQSRGIDQMYMLSSIDWVNRFKNILDIANRKDEEPTEEIPHDNMYN